MHPIADSPPAGLPAEIVDAPPARGARIALALLLTINLMNYVDRQILSAVESLIGRDYHIAPDKTGALASAFLVSYMIFSPIFALLSARWRRWTIIGVGVTLWSFASGGSGAVKTFGLLIAMRLLIGIGEAAYAPIAPSILADVYPVKYRGRVMAWFSAALPVGSALGYVVGGAFGDNWRWAFYSTLPPGLLLAALCFFMREPKLSAGGAAPLAASPPVPVEPRDRIKARLRDYGMLARIPSYFFATAGMTAMTFATGGIGFFMPRYLVEVGHQDPTRSKLTFGIITAVAGLASAIAGGWVGDKFRSRIRGSYFVVSAFGAFAGFPLMLLMLVTPFPACWIVIFMAIFCLFFNTGPTNTILANIVRPAARATAFGLNILVIHLLGDVISPPAIGWIAKHSNMKVAFAVVGVVVLLAGVAWMMGAKYLEEDSRRAVA